MMLYRHVTEYPWDFHVPMVKESVPLVGVDARSGGDAQTAANF
jgi:hypothetical protein